MEAGLELEGSEGVVEEADLGGEEEMDVSSVESRAISPESVPMDQEDLELGLERASVTAVESWDISLESAALPGEEGSSGQSGLDQIWKHFVHICQYFKFCYEN